MPANDLGFFEAIDRLMGGQGEVDVQNGVIQVINGATALVRIGGGDRIQEAWYAKGANLQPGDHCILVRTGRQSRWIVLGGYGTAGGGGSDEDAVDETIEGFRHSYYYTSGSEVGGEQTLYSVSVESSGRPLVIWVAVNGRCNQVSKVANLFVQIKIGGTEVAERSMTNVPYGGFYAVDLYYMTDELSAGSYTVTVTTDGSASNAAYLLNHIVIHEL